MLIFWSRNHALQRKGSEAYHGRPQPGIGVRIRDTQMVFPDPGSSQEWLHPKGHVLLYHMLQYLMTERELRDPELLGALSFPKHRVAATDQRNHWPFWQVPVLKIYAQAHTPIHSKQKVFTSHKHDSTRLQRWSDHAKGKNSPKSLKVLTYEPLPFSWAQKIYIIKNNM